MRTCLKSVIGSVILRVDPRLKFIRQSFSRDFAMEASSAPTAARRRGEPNWALLTPLVWGPILPLSRQVMNATKASPNFRLKTYVCLIAAGDLMIRGHCVEQSLTYLSYSICSWYIRDVGITQGLNEIKCFAFSFEYLDSSDLNCSE